MSTWDDLDKKYGGSASPAQDAGGWDKLDAKHAQVKKADPTPADTTPAPVADFSGNLRFATPFGTIDTGVALPEAVNRRLAQFGSGVTDAALGVQQRFASDKPKTTSDLVTGNTESASLKREVAAKRTRDAGLNNDFAGKALNIGGQVAPSLAIPAGYLGVLGKAAPIVEGLIAGGVSGAAQPTAEGESAGMNAALGAAGGAALPGLFAGARAVAKPANQGAADLAAQYGIPLGVADTSGNRFVKAARSLLSDLPGLGAIGNAQTGAKQTAFNRAVGGTFGADAERLTPDVMTAAKGAVTGELNRLWGGNTLKLDVQLFNDLHAIEQRAVTDLNPEQAKLVSNQIQKLLQQSTNSEVPGAFANNWQSELRLAVDGEKGLAKKVLNDLRQSTLQAFNRGIAPQDAAALGKARGQYGNFKTIEPLMAKAEFGVGGRVSGDVPAGLLAGQVNQQMGSRAIGSDLGNLAQVGSHFLVDRVAQTGGSPRAMLQNAAVLGGAGGVGGAAAMANPVGAAAGTGTAALLQWMLGSPAVRKMLTDPRTQRGLLAEQMAARLPAATAPGLLQFPGP